MGISCSCDAGDDWSWFYYSESLFTDFLDKKRSVRCKSCKELIRPYQMALHIPRWRSPRTDIEESIHGDEVPLATWHLCLPCAKIFLALDSIHVCVSLGVDHMEDCLTEFDRFHAPKGFALNVSRLAAQHNGYKRVDEEKNLHV